MKELTNHSLSKNNVMNNEILLGIAGIEKQYDHYTFLYILRSLYKIVFKAKYLKENKDQLQRRIMRFEKDSSLPGLLSAIPIERLLSQLEDAQYFYPVSRKKVSIPLFK